MNPLRGLLWALTSEADEHAARTRAVAASLKALRADLQQVRREMGAVAARAAAVSQQVAQIRRIRQGNRDLGAVLDGLAAVLDAGRVAAHVRAALDRATLLEHPVPRVVIERLWPEDVFHALIRAIPEPVFFDGVPAGPQTLRVPPRLAPVSAIATWTFVAEIVHDVMVPAVAARLADLSHDLRLAPGTGEAATARLDIAPGRLVRCPSDATMPPAAKLTQGGLIVMDLSTEHEVRGALCRVTGRTTAADGQAFSPASADCTLAGGANTAVAVWAPATTCLPLAPAAGVRHTYELWFGPKPA